MFSMITRLQTMTMPVTRAVGMPLRAYYFHIRRSFSHHNL